MFLKRALVIGNGESRKNINLQLFTNTIPMIGCNAVHRDAIVDHLICCDYRMVAESVQNKNTVGTLIYTRNEHINKFPYNTNLIPLPDIPYPQRQRIDNTRNWGSGPFAMLVAALLDYDRYMIIGFDLYGTNNSCNNIYKDTKNYSRSSSHSVDPSYWIYQCGKIFSIFNHKTFEIYNIKDWKLPDQWQLPNVELYDLDSFADVAKQINNLYN